MNKITICFLAFFSFNNLIFSQNFPWPVSTDATTGRTRIAGNIGEFRGNNAQTSHRFHQGIDFSRDHGRSIYAMTDGLLTFVSSGNNSYLQIEETDGTLTFYVHTNQSGCTNCATLNTNVLAGDLIGFMIRTFTSTGTETTHLHLEYGDENILDNLSNFTDNSIPSFSNAEFTNGIRFNRDGLHWAPTGQANGQQILNQVININGNNYTLLHDKIDIEAHLVDTRIANNGNAAVPNGQLAPYEVSFVIRNQSNNIRAEQQQTGIVSTHLFTFDEKPTNDNAAEFCFSPESMHPGNPSVHIITSSYDNIPWDRYFNTKLRSGVTQNWPASTTPDYMNQNARINEEANYPDGIYTIDFTGRDIDSDATFNNVTHDENILIDNFLPYVKKVEMRLADLNLGTQEWTMNNSTNQIEYSEINTTITGPVDASDGTVIITVEGSETLQDLALSINIGNNTIPSGTPTITDNRIYAFEITVNSLSNLTDEICLEISGHDLAGNELLAFQNMTGYNTLNPTRSNIVLPARNQTGNWMPTPQYGTNEVHCFNFIFCENDGGRNRGIVQIINLDNCLDVNTTITNASSSADSDGAIMLEVSGGLAPYTFNWEDGATTSTRSDLPSGEYCVTITDDSCCETEQCYTVKGGCIAIKVVPQGE